MPQIPKPAHLEADVIVSADQLWPHLDMRELVRRFWAIAGIPKIPPPITTIDGVVDAEINQGRWIVRCPNAETGCNGAMYASPRDPVFLCANCGSPEKDGAWYRVRFPRSKRRIEAVLLARPAATPHFAAHRNWTPGETVEQLERENAENGVGG